MRLSVGCIKTIYSGFSRVKPGPRGLYRVISLAKAGIPGAGAGTPGHIPPCPRTLRKEGPAGGGGRVEKQPKMRLLAQLQSKKQRGRAAGRSLQPELGGFAAGKPGRAPPRPLPAEPAAGPRDWKGGGIYSREGNKEPQTCCHQSTFYFGTPRVGRVGRLRRPPPRVSPASGMVCCCF